MHRFRVFLVVLSCLLGVRGAEAETAAERYVKAGRAFEALVPTAVVKGEMPRKSDPAVRSLLAILSDEERRFGTSEFPADLVSMDICSAANKTSMQYMMFGLEAEFRARGFDLKNAPPSQAALNEALLRVMARNVETYQEEMLPVSFFGVHCMAGTLPALESFVAALPPEQVTPVRLDGLRKLRTGVAGIIVGTFQMLRGTGGGIHDSLIERARVDLPTDLVVLARVLTPTERRSTLAQVGASGEGGDPKLQEVLDVVRRALADPACDGLCKY